ncbi:MAG: transglutaminase domain-containing protein [Spirochaetia bacterium]
MIRKILIWILRSLSFLLYSALLPILAYFVLQPSGPYYLVFAFLICVLPLWYISGQDNPKAAKTARTLLLWLYTILAFTVLTNILMTPYSAFKYWTELFSQWEQSGAVSFTFFMITVFITSISAGIVLQKEVFRPFLILSLFAIALASIIMSAIWLYLISGIVIFIAVLYQIYRKSYSKKSLQPACMSIPFLLIILSISLIWGFGSAPEGSLIVDSLIHPISRQFILKLFPEFPLLYNIPGYGHGFDHGRLGGQPALSDQEVLRLYGDKGKYYLRNNVYTVYTGSSWNLAERSGGIKYPETSGNPGPSIEILLDYMVGIPHTLEFSDFSFHNSERASGYYGDRSTGYGLERALLFEESYTLYQNPDFPEEPDNAPYLQVPTGIPRELELLAGQLSGSSALDTARNIFNYFEDNCIYTLSTSPPSRSVDFVSNFLFEQQQGYCVHFASAMAVLLRLNGYQARYVTGFVAKVPGNQSSTTITGHSAHAWVEVWTRDNGWATIEATPLINAIGNDENINLSQYALMQDLGTARQVEAIFGHTVLQQSDESSFFQYLRVLIYAASALVLVIILALLLRALYKISTMSMHDRFIKELNKLRPKNERIFRGWLVRLEEISIWNPHIRHAYFRRLRSVILTRVYGNQSITKKDIKYLRCFRKNLFIYKK